MLQDLQVYPQNYCQVIATLQQGHPLGKALSELSLVLCFISGVGISEEPSRLQKQLHKHLTCRPLRWRMQYLGLPTNIGYRIIEDHKIFRSALEAMGQ